MRVICYSSGFTDYAIQLANALSKKEDVMLILLNSSTVVEYLSYISENVNLYLSRKTIHPLWWHPTNLLIPFEIIKAIYNFNPDVIHVQAGDLLFCLFFPFLKKYPLVTTFHDPKPHVGQEKDLTLKFIQHWMRKHSNKIIVHGKKLKEIIVKEYDLSRDNVHAITIGEHEVAPFKKYERKDLKEDGNLILLFGWLSERKGIEYLIKTKPMIVNKVPDAKIILAGRKGINFEKYEKMMIDDDDFIIYSHYIPYKEGAELFQRSSVVVLPYIEASQSGVIPTAYGFKKPVVVTNVGAMPEIVDDGVTGIIVPPKNPEALAEAIVKLLKDDKLRRQMGKNAYKKLKTDLSWDKIAEKTIEVYERAMGEHKKGIK